MKRENSYGRYLTQTVSVREKTTLDEPKMYWAGATKMSYQMKLDPKSRKAARLISQLQKKIQKAFVSTGKTQQEIATILGVDRSVINRRLTGSANLTVRSIAELAYAFDKDIKIEFVDRPSMKRPSDSESADKAEKMQHQENNCTRGTADSRSPFSSERTAL